MKKYFTKCNFQLFFILIILFTTITLFWGGERVSYMANQVYLQLRSSQNQSKIAEILKERESVRSENYDEFIHQVLQEVPFEEVDFLSRNGFEGSEFDRELDLEKARIIPGLFGDNGRSLDFETVFSQGTKEQMEESINKEGFNDFLSSLIDPLRKLPDTRNSECLNVTYDEYLPSLSVIIPLFNEPMSSLVRTIHNLVNRTSPDNLKEILLIDDCSYRKELLPGGKFERYLVREFPPGVVRLVRLQTKAGAIRARMIGAHLATGDVIYFFDCHMEVENNWSEPLLQRIKQNRKVLATSVLNFINYRDLSYTSYGDNFNLEGFWWNGMGRWLLIPEYEKERRGSPIAPTRSPMTPGGAFAMDRHYFWEIGSWDPGLISWGVESLEISFRAWMCGGSIEYLPCSRVGHIFRHHKPIEKDVVIFHKNTFLTSISQNAVRVAEIWMDEYKEIVYNDMENRRVDFGDISKRVELRNRLNCSSFKEYLDSTYKELFTFQIGNKFSGQIRNELTKHCLSGPPRMTGLGDVPENYNVTFVPCVNNTAVPPRNYRMTFTQNDMLRVDEFGCLVREGDIKVIVKRCHNLNETTLGETWNYLDEFKQIVHNPTGKCLSLGYFSANDLFLRNCTKGNDQLLKWTLIPIPKSNYTIY